MAAARAASAKSFSGAGKSAGPARIRLLYGNREAELQEARLRIVREVIPSDDDRRDNVVEIQPPANRPLALAQVQSQILAELGQQSLFGDLQRVVVVYQLQEFFSSAGASKAKEKAGAGTAAPKKASKKPSAADAVATFFDHVDGIVAVTGNTLLFVVVEDQAKMKLVNERSPMFAAVSERGRVDRFASKPYRFELTEALLNRSLPQAIEVVSAWRQDDGRQAAGAIFRALNEDIQCLVQAAIYDRERHKMEDDPAWKETLFPSSLRPSLLTIHEFRRGRYMQAVRMYPSMELLLDALRSLLEIQRALFPTGDELYVKDADYLIDLLLAKLLGTR